MEAGDCGNGLSSSEMGDQPRTPLSLLFMDLLQMGLWDRAQPGELWALAWPARSPSGALRSALFRDCYRSFH